MKYIFLCKFYRFDALVNPDGPAWTDREFPGTLAGIFWVDFFNSECPAGAEREFTGTLEAELSGFFWGWLVVSVSIATPSPFSRDLLIIIKSRGGTLLKLEEEMFFLLNNVY